MNALKQLTELDLQERKKRTPNVPDFALTRRKFSDKTANKLTGAIMHFLRLKGWHAERVNVTGRPIDRTKVVTNTLGQRHVIGSIDWIPGGGQRGSADIHALIAVRSVYIEVKKGKDRLSEYQKQYRDQVEAAGAKYWLVRSFDEFIEYYETIIHS